MLDTNHTFRNLGCRHADLPIWRCPAHLPSGDMAKTLADMNLNQFVWLGIAVLMLTPILMVFLTLVLPQSVSRWANIIVAVFFSCSTWLACPPIHRYMTNSCWRSA